MKKKNFVPAATEKEWNIPQDLMKKSNHERLVEMLASFNKINNTTSFYIRDSFQKKIIVDSPASDILCGYKKEFAEIEGFDFYKRIFVEKEWSWFEKMFTETQCFLQISCFETQTFGE